TLAALTRCSARRCSVAPSAAGAGVRAAWPCCPRCIPPARPATSRGRGHWGGPGGTGAGGGTRHGRGPAGLGGAGPPACAPGAGALHAGGAAPLATRAGAESGRAARAALPEAAALPRDHRDGARAVLATHIEAIERARFWRTAALFRADVDRLCWE